MGTPYGDVHDVFIQKISDYDILSLDQDQAFQIFDRYLNSACEAFNGIFDEADLSRDNTLRTFNNILDDHIIEIIATGMIYYWLNPKVLSTDNLHNVMKTRDFTPFSPAELLAQLKDVRSQVKRDFRNMIIEYTYFVGDVSGDV